MRPAFVLGTRPEILKLYPVIREFKDPHIIFTEQHPYKICAPFFEEFNLKAIKYTPNIDTSSLSSSLADIITKIDGALRDTENPKPDCVVVQGDTTTALAAAQVAFFNKLPVFHVEAGMRSFSVNPFPEEMNRRLISRLATFHFCPTYLQVENLHGEGIWDNIHVTGNTVVDALLHTKKTRPKIKNQVLVALHRREIFGPKLNAILLVLNQLAAEFRPTTFVVSLHSNPSAAIPAQNILHARNILFIENKSYNEFAEIMDQSALILTDSGGISEEAAVLNKPFLVLRKEIDRPEVLKIGKLAGIEPSNIYKEFKKTWKEISKSKYSKPKFNLDIIGDGTAGKRIANTITGLGV